MPIWTESDELTVAFSWSELSSIKGTVKISTELLAVSDCVFNIVNSALLAELSKTSSENVGVLAVLLVTLIDLIIRVSVDDAVSKAVSAVVANATPLNL